MSYINCNYFCTDDVDFRDIDADHDVPDVDVSSTELDYNTWFTPPAYLLDERSIISSDNFHSQVLNDSVSNAIAGNHDRCAYWLLCLLVRALERVSEPSTSEIEFLAQQQEKDLLKVLST